MTERREAILFLHEGALWVADFIDGEGELVDANTWVRFNCGGTELGAAQRRMMHELAQPLSLDIAAKIEALLLGNGSVGTRDQNNP